MSQVALSTRWYISSLVNGSIKMIESVLGRSQSHIVFINRIAYQPLMGGTIGTRGTPTGSAPGGPIVYDIEEILRIAHEEDVKRARELKQHGQVVAQIVGGEQIVMFTCKYCSRVIAGHTLREVYVLSKRHISSHLKRRI